MKNVPQNLNNNVVFKKKIRVALVKTLKSLFPFIVAKTSVETPKPYSKTYGAQSWI